jgi:hypothetical protein
MFSSARNCCTTSEVWLGALIVMQEPLLIAFFDIDGLVHHEFLPPGQSVAGHFYMKFLQRLYDAFRRKLRDKWQGQWFLHHDNAPSHTLFVVRQFLAEENIPVITQSSYSVYLTLSDFCLFPTLKMGLKGTRFPTMEDIKSNATVQLWNIPNKAFCQCFQQWQD